jgi:hypothetical protein
MQKQLGLTEHDLRWSVFGFGTKGEVSVSFLPLSQVAARHVDFALYDS